MLDLFQLLFFEWALLGSKFLVYAEWAGSSFCWITAVAFYPIALSDATSHLAEERYLGTLERISITKTPFIHILIARNIVHCLFTLIQTLVVGGILYVVFKPDLSYMSSSWRVTAMVVVIGMLIILTLYAFGFFIASLGMIFKRVGATTSILEYLILFFQE